MFNNEHQDLTLLNTQIVFLKIAIRSTHKLHHAGMGGRVGDLGEGGCLGLTTSVMTYTLIRDDA